MKSFSSLSMLLLLLAIAGCTPLLRKPAEAPKPEAAAPAKPAQLPPAPKPPSSLLGSPVQVVPLAGAVFDSVRADLDAGQADAALAKLDSLHPEQLDSSAKLQWHSQRAAVYSLQGNLMDAIRERVAADTLQTDPAVRRRNQEAIVEALALLPPERLGGYPMVSGDPLSGWLALGLILAAQDSPEMRRQALAQWRQDYPGHPADSDWLQTSVQRSPTPASVPASAPSSLPAGAVSAVAVLLPASGSSALFGEAVRQGINAAHAGDGEPDKPALRFYDSESGDVAALYRRALEEGAQMVIGPLRKEQVAALAEAGDLPKPVLALNRVDAVRDGLYQFSLLPEDELEQAADIAWQDGRRNALVLVPAKDFGQRMLNYFNDYWQRLGGRVVAVQTYLPGEKDFAQPIKKLLQVDEPGKASAPTPRNDADAVFLISEVRDARMLVPQLRYYGATRLPIYATSSVYAGRPNRAQDQDLAGVVFCDAPWLLTENYAAQRQAAADAGSANGASARLWAMGMDAYRLSRRLDTLQSGDGRFAGASGELSLGLDSRIHRQLTCARFDNGVPVLRESAQPAIAGPESAPAATPH